MCGKLGREEAGEGTQRERHSTKLHQITSRKATGIVDHVLFLDLHGAESPGWKQISSFPETQSPVTNIHLLNEMSLVQFPVPSQGSYTR